MRQPWIPSALLLLLFAQVPRSNPQTAPAPDAPTYGLRVRADEVTLTFRAVDAQGHPVNDLQLNELRLFDNGSGPRRIIALDLLRDQPIRAGILLDTSQSTLENRATDRAIAIRFTQHLMQQPANQAFVLNFAYQAILGPSWTRNPIALADGIHNHQAGANARSGISGTAILDAIYSTCLSEFGSADPAPGANVILLFSDGEDTASRDSLQAAIARCQRSNTAIYAFRPKNSSRWSSGPTTLADLASQSGVRVFYDDDSDAAIEDDLRTIDTDLHNRYRLVYRPPQMKHDGSFHQVVLLGPERVASLTARSGYYAPVQ
jgi:Ca-activated chloride channel family protein